MAYIFKNQDSNYWHAGFRDSTGKRVNRSTRVLINPYHEDLKERARLAGEARRNAQVVADSFERIVRGELSRERDLRDTINSLIELAGGKRIEEPSVESFFNAWIDNTESSRAKGTHARYKQVARDFLQHIGDRRREPIGNVTATDIQDYLDDLANTRASKTVLNHLRIIQIPFAEAHKHGKIKVNPAVIAEVKGKIKSVTREDFTVEEIRAILKACDNFTDGDEWKTAVMFGYFCGARLGDAVSMKWSNIDFEKMQIEYNPEKTGDKTLMIPIHSELQKHLATLTPSVHPEARITPTLCTAPGKRAKLSKTFAQLLIQAGVTSDKEKSRESQQRTVSKKSFHSLRHAIITHLDAAKVSKDLRMLLVGHSDERVHGGYTHPKIEAMRAAIESIQIAQ
jgi:integrase